MSKWIILVLGAFLAGINTSAWALTADEIMQRVNDREDGDNIFMEMQMVLINKMSDDYGDVELEIMKVTLASGRDVYRVISEPIRLDAARSICTHFWSIQYGCIIKLHN